DGRTILVINFVGGANCQCTKIEVLRDNVSLGTFNAAPDITVGACAKGEYCVRCIADDGTAGPLHCCKLESCETGGLQRPADCNQDGNTDISDAVCLFGHLFLGSPARL